MAFKAKNFTLDGTSQPLATTHIPVKWVRVENTTGNADVKIGDSTLTAAIFGFTVTAGPATIKDIGPFSGGECPFNLENVFVKGTDGQVIHITYVTL